MISVPRSVMDDYVAILRSRTIPSTDLEHYKKWLRYFYDFYSKYLDTGDKPAGFLNGLYMEAVFQGDRDLEN